MKGKTTGENGGEQDGRQREAALKKQRLAEQLRRNLSRRKAQSRARRDGDADQRDEGLPAAQSETPPDES